MHSILKEITISLSLSLSHNHQIIIQQIIIMYWDTDVTCSIVEESSKNNLSAHIIRHYSVHALLNQVMRYETCNSKRRYYCIPVTTFILIIIEKLIRSTFLCFLASNSTSPVCTTSYPLMCTWARCVLEKKIFKFCKYIFAIS